MATASDPTAAREPSKDLPYWTANIDHKITDDVRNFFESYSGITSDRVSSHIHGIHERAWEIRPYPCVGLGGFLASTLARHPAYPEILQRLQTGTFVDIGAFVGQELRKLALEGISQERLFATDIVNYWDLGYELYNDRDKFRVHYIESDILNPTPELRALFGDVDVVSVSHLLHQWGWETQVRACVELCNLSKPGTMIVGYQTGTSDIRKRSEWNRTRFMMHDPESFRRMWEGVAGETGTRWDVDVEIRPWAECGYSEDETGYLGEDFSLLRFLIRRLA